MSQLVPLAIRRRNRAMWQACLRGQEPAESLPTREREQLLMLLVSRGLSDVEIALVTRMTVYTTVRIRERLGVRSQAVVSHAPLGRAS